MKRIGYLIAGISIAVAPAATGLIGNVSFAERMPVRAPSNAMPVADDHGSDHSATPRPSGTRTPEVESTHGTPEVELEHGTPEVETEHGTPEVETEHGTPEVETEHGTPEVESTHESENEGPDDGSGSGGHGSDDSGSGDSGSGGHGSDG